MTTVEKKRNPTSGRVEKRKHVRIVADESVKPSAVNIPEPKPA